MPHEETDRASTDRTSLVDLPVVVIGGGPIGLAAACHLLERGLEPLVLEVGDRPAASVAAWGHVRMFSPWSYSIDAAAARLLARHGWTPPDPAVHPTGAELIARYLAPLAAAPEIAARLRLGARVVGVARRRVGKIADPGRAGAPFAVRVRDNRRGEEIVLAHAIIDASGTWTHPAPAGADGLPAIGEREPAAAARIRYGMPDVTGAERARYAGRRVAVLGSGHSALGSLLALAELSGTTPVWLLRRPALGRVFGGGARDALAERGAVGTRAEALVRAGRVEAVAGFALERIRATEAGLELSDGARSIAADELIVATGFRPDLSILSELRLALDPALDCPRALGPLIDPNLHSCGTVPPHGAETLAHPEPGLFVVGMKSYGRAPTFLLATGHEQARSVAAFLAGDIEAARRVELALPETGVCVTDDAPASGCCTAPAVVSACRPPPPAPAASASCCGGPALAATDACCATDAAAKAAGSEGCGCGPAAPRAAACCGA